MKKNINVIIVAVVLSAVLFVLLKQTAFYNQILMLPFFYYLKLILISIKPLFNLCKVPYEIIENLTISINGRYLDLDSRFLMKKWLFMVLPLFWVFPSALKEKILRSLIWILYNYLIISLKIFLYLFLIYKNFTTDDAEYLGQAFASISFLLFLIFWVKNNAEIWHLISQKLKIKETFLITKFHALSFVILIYVVINLLIGIYNFEGWIHVLFSISHYILGWFGYNSVVEPFYLLGEYGNVYMEKRCLGIITTYLFAGFVYLTGEKLKPKLLFILAGTIVLNVANILRFVFVFIHINEYGKYLWKIEIHDLFNYILYILVFLLWVLWINKFSDTLDVLKKVKLE